MKRAPSNHNNFALISPIKETIFSFHTAMNLYNAYTLGGRNHAGVVAVTSVVDGVLSSNNITGKNYLSLSSFWGYLAWSAIQQVQSSKTIPSQYKVPLYAASSLIGLGMVTLGPDIFAPKIGNKNVADSVRLMASFFDKTNIIKPLEESFNKSYVTGVIYLVSNIKQLLSNKFILFCLLYQGIDLAKLVLIQKYFQYLPTEKMASFFAAKEESPLSYLVKLSLLKLVKEVIEVTHSKMTIRLSEGIRKDIDKQVIEIVLRDDNTSKVMDLGPRVNDLSNQISAIFNKTTTGTGQTMQGVVIPLLLQSSPSHPTSKKVLDSNPSLFLLNSLINTIFNYTNINILEKWIEATFFGSKKEGASEDVEISAQKFGMVTLTTITTPSDYAYANIQEIAKLGGNEYMLGKVLAYIDKNSTSNSQSKPAINSLLNFAKNMIQEFLYAGIFISQGIGQKEFLSIETDIGILTGTLGLNDLNMPLLIGDQQAGPAEIMVTLKVLKEKRHGGPERLLSDYMTLFLEDYHLKKKAAPSDMLHIRELAFEPGHIYAVTGKIGTGKTTLLTDIAKCLMPVFGSSGKIFYPMYQGHAIKEIFCGTIAFSPPATTLFERLTYRLDQQFVNLHKEDIMQFAMRLFTQCGQHGFSREKLSTKGSDDKLSLSTGQTKLAIIFGAIIYKKYINAPALFVMDETLANLDIDTTHSICKIIKATFYDSIVLSVDHNAKHNREFYTDLIDLAGYVPETEDVLMIGDI